MRYIIIMSLYIMSASKFFPRSVGNFVTRNEFLNAIELITTDIENLEIDVSGIISDLSFGEANKVVFRDGGNNLATDDLFGYDGETLTIGLETKTATFIPDLKLEVSGGVFLSGYVIIDGSLNVMGDLTTINTIQLDVSANKLTLNKGLEDTGLPPSVMLESGFIIERGTEPDYHIFYKENCKSLHVGISGEALYPLAEREEEITEGSILVWTRRVGYPTCNGYLKEVALNWDATRLKIGNTLDMSCNLMIDVSNILFCNGVNLLDTIGTIDASINILEGRLDVVDVSIGVLDGRLDVADVSIGILEGRMDVADISIGVLEGRLDIVDISIGILEGRLDVVDISIADLYDIKYDKTGGLINGNVSISGELDMCCNLIKDVSAIWVCGTRVRIGNVNTGTGNNGFSVSIGIDAGTGQQQNAVAIGHLSGASQGTESVAIGYNAGGQGINTVAVGHNAGRINQAKEAIAVGFDAGVDNQGEDAIAFGQEAGNTDQGERALAFGYRAGSNKQGTHAIALGDSAGRQNQCLYSLALGNNAGEEDQSCNTIAIGRDAGRFRQGTGSIAIGKYAGYEDQHPRSIVINGLDVSLNTGGTERLYIKPIREKTDFDISGILTYDMSGEITNNTAILDAFLDVCYNSVWKRDNSGNIYYDPEPLPTDRFRYGYVGIGTTNPQRPLHFVQYANGQTTIALQQFDTSVNQVNVISFRDASFVETGAIDFRRPVPSDLSRNKIGFYTRSREFNGSFAEAVSIDGITLEVRKIASFIESAAVDICDNAIIRGTLDMCCNIIQEVSGIYFCDGTYIGQGSSFDICTNEVLKITSNNGISQVINTDGDTLFLDGQLRTNLTERVEKIQIHSLSAGGSAAGFYCYDAAANNSTRLEMYKNESGNINIDTAVGSASTLGFIGFQGMSATGYLRGATIQAVTENTNVATGLRFLTKGTTGTAATRMTINSLGNVGIGTTGPDTLLHIEINNATNAIPLKLSNINTGVFGNIVGVQFENTGTTSNLPAAIGSNNNDLVFFTGLNATNPSERLRIKDDGNVGIGTINPTNKLMIQNGNYSMSDTGYALGLTTNNFGIILEVSGNIGNSAALWIKNDTPSAPYSTILRANNDGNVSIGQNYDVNYPAQLQVKDYAGIGIQPNFWGTSTLNAPSYWTPYGYLGTNGSFDLALSSNGYRNTSGTWTTLNAGGFTGASLISMRPADGSIRFCTATTFPTGSASIPPQRMSIDGSGTVIMSQPSANYIFTSNSTSGYTTTINMDNIGLGISHNSTSRNITFGTGAGTAITIDGNRNVGIRTAPSLNVLEINGNTNIVGNFSVSGTKSFKIRHPLREGYVIYNNAIEAPRCEIIFRGKVNMVGGGGGGGGGGGVTQTEINIDTHVGYTDGTFVETTKNPQCFVNNETSFEAVRATIAGNILTIYVNKGNSTDTISWMVIAERDDEEIHNSELVDETGSLIPEQEE